VIGRRYSLKHPEMRIPSGLFERIVFLCHKKLDNTGNINNIRVFWNEISIGAHISNKDVCDSLSVIIHIPRLKICSTNEKDDNEEIEGEGEKKTKSDNNTTIKQRQKTQQNAEIESIEIKKKCLPNECIGFHLPPGDSIEIFIVARYQGVEISHELREMMNEAMTKVLNGMNEVICENIWGEYNLYSLCPYCCQNTIRNKGVYDDEWCHGIRLKLKIREDHHTHNDQKHQVQLLEKETKSNYMIKSLYCCQNRNYLLNPLDLGFYQHNFTNLAAHLTDKNKALTPQSMLNNNGINSHNSNNSNNGIQLGDVDATNVTIAIHIYNQSPPSPPS